MEKLIFVYNADSGKWNAYMDMAHKIFSPSTYPCSLCDLTYGIFKIRPEWETFIENAPMPFEFLHKDEFHQQYPAFKNLALPVILIQNKINATNVLISQFELDKLVQIQDLEHLILSKLKDSTYHD